MLQTGNKGPAMAPHNAFRLASAILLSILLPGLTPPCASASSHGPRLLLHAQAKNASKVICGTPTITTCQQANTQAFFHPDGTDLYYVFLVASVDTADGVRELEIGVDYDQNTGAGVDVYSWTLCADSETGGLGWYQERGGNRITWQSKGNDGLRVAGFFYLSAYSSGYFALVSPVGGSAMLTPFSGPPDTLDAGSLGFIGFSVGGCNPCLTPCDYTPVRASTWSSLKRLFVRSP
jgi:hypothetical protein